MTTHPILFSTPMVQAILEGRKTMTRRISKITPLDVANENLLDDILPIPIEQRCPYGQPGDILWVRESFFNHFSDLYSYKADNTKGNKKWKPSIHMPKAACRIFLRITDIRVERLKNITEEDANNEGVFLDMWDNKVTAFSNLWKKINGHDSWSANPWVWVISFERCEKPENF
ncbi:MAG TPA: hypothetical protein PKN48_16195 [Bacteroidales bacterium]|nr:hypothetical protein [Bacteroidales bacterium]